LNIAGYGFLEIASEDKMEYCKLCDKPADIIVEQIESSVLEMIKKHNPEWVEADGSCMKCVAYYESLDEGIVQDE